MMIFSPFERMVGWRYLRARRAEGFISLITWFSLLGIALGVATLIVVMAVMNGFRQELFTRILGINGHMYLSAYAGPLYDYDAKLERVRALAGIKLATPIIEGQGLITINNTARGIMIRGMKQEDILARTTIASHIRAGSLQNFKDDGIAIGIRMADSLRLKVGDSLTLVSAQSRSSAFGTVPRYKAYPIVAIFDIGMYEYDSSFVFMPMPAAQVFYRMENAVSSIEIFVADQMKVGDYTDAVKAAGGPTSSVQDWQHRHEAFLNTLKVERNVMFLILTLIILVAAFNVISSMFMLVKDKGSDIAILRTMGASKGTVLRIFFLSGASIGVTGTICGSALGILIAANMESVRQFFQWLTKTKLFDAEFYYLSEMPAVVEWHEVAQVVAMALVISFLATIYPARRAASLDPVEALRYE